jgi:paraquat-inducible protein B
MAKKTNPVVTGAFVAGAVLLAIAAVVIWGSRSMFERKYEYVCYFGGSVNGLAKGAPVKYRGVDVGVVKDIKIRYRQPPDDHRIPVFIEAWGRRLRELGGEQEPTPERIRDLVAHGLRARLETQSLVTGVLYISLDFAPDAPITQAEFPNGGIPEIPTLPTELEEATRSVADVLMHLKRTDFEGMSASISKAALGVTELTRDRDLRIALTELPKLLGSAHELTSTLNRDAERMTTIIDDAHAAMTSLRSTLDSARGVIAPRAPLSVDVARTLANVGKAAVAIHELADFLRRNPHALVAGAKPRGQAQ